VPRSWPRFAAAAAAWAAVAGAGAGAGEPVLDVRGAAAPVPPLHPTEIVTAYQGADRPLIGVGADVCLIDDDGKAVRRPTTAAYHPVRVSQFAPGSLAVQVERAENLALTDHGFASIPGRAAPSVAFAFRVTADRPYTDCYLALIVFDRDSIDGQAESAGAPIAYQGIGDLRAGAPVAVSAGLHDSDLPRRPFCLVPLFFTRGLEIRTPFDEASAGLFRQAEVGHHRKLLSAYLSLHGSDTLPAKAYLRFPPVFDGKVDRARIPEKLGVSFAVTPQGTVEHVVPSAALEAAARQEVERAVGGWLYMPQLARGTPLETPMSAVLEFRLTAR
jgi:hypothetical protein